MQNKLNLAHAMMWPLLPIVGNKELLPALQKAEMDAIVLSPISIANNFSIEFLSLQEQQRHQNYIHSGDQKRFLAAHGLIRSVLANYYQVAPKQIEFKCCHWGKPFVANPATSLCFNLSHSGSWVGIGFGWDPLGFDVEQRVNLSSFPATEVGHPQDVISLHTAELATLVWTIKESVLKADGIGLGFPLKKLKIEYDYIPYWWKVQLNNHIWHVKAGFIEQGQAAMAIAVKSVRKITALKVLSLA